MRWLRGETPDSSFERLRNALRASSLKTRLMIGLIPPIMLIMAAAVYLTFCVSWYFINNAFERAALLETIALRNEMELLLEHYREDLADFVENEVHDESLRRYLARFQERSPKESFGLFGVAFLSRKNPEHIAYLADETRIVQVGVDTIRPNLLAAFEILKNVQEGEVWISPLVEMELPFPEPENPNQRLSRQAFSMVTPAARGKEDQGYLIFLLDARCLRNRLMVHEAEGLTSPLRLRGSEPRIFYVFDAEGWVLFESETPKKAQGELATHRVRSGFTGTLGRKGQPFAFRPDSTFEIYWNMVEEVMRGKHGVVTLPAPFTGGPGRSDFLAYAPVRFRSSPAAPAVPIGGLAFREAIRPSAASGFEPVGLVLTILAVAAVLVAALTYAVGRVIVRPIHRLAEAVPRAAESLQPIRLPCHGKEIAALQQAVNGLLVDLQSHREKLRRRERALREEGSQREARLERPASGVGADPVPGIVGRGPRVERLKAEIVKASQVDFDVLIVGETGSGKQLAAEAIHRLSTRAAAPFVSINCGALDENLLLDTLFGHVRGAFTEAKADRKGAFLEADGGTLFLDEIGELSQAVQVKLLRFLQGREFQRIGDNRTLHSDVRVISATNRDLSSLIREGTFREDLYYRLNVVGITIPPLRERKEDIPPLMDHFLKRFAAQNNRSIEGFSPEARDLLLKYEYPGNVRELENIVERAVVIARGTLISTRDLPFQGGVFPSQKEGGGGPRTLTEAVEALEREMIQEALDKARYNQTRAAEALGISERTLRYKLQKYGFK